MRVTIYSDKGVGPFSLRQTAARFREKKASIRLVNKEKLLTGEWLKETDLFVMPGGRDTPYHDALSGLGTDLIRLFVEQGGSYLGICAGAYFACQAIEFEKGNELEVTAKRDLAFFPGLAYGPALGQGTFTYESEKGAKAARLILESQEQVTVYYNGGCYFDEPGQQSGIQVIARYRDLPNHPPAIVYGTKGKGRFALTGVHLEYKSTSLNTEDAYLKNIIPTLLEFEVNKTKLWNSILDIV